MNTDIHGKKCVSTEIVSRTCEVRTLITFGNYESDLKCTQWSINIVLICLAFHKIKNEMLPLVCQTHQLFGQIHFEGIWRMFHYFKSCLLRRGGLLPTPTPQESNVENRILLEKISSSNSQGKVISYLPPQPPSRTTRQFCSIAFFSSPPVTSHSYSAEEFKQK